MASTELIDTAIAGVGRIFAQLQADIETTFGTPIDSIGISGLRRRADLIAQIRYLSIETGALTKNVIAYGLGADTRHAAEVARVRESLVSVTDTSTPRRRSWSTVRSKRPPPAGGAAQAAGPVLAPSSVPPTDGVPHPAPVCAGVTLRAIWLPPDVGALSDVAALMTRPDIYYVPKWGHFAIRVGEIVLHANVGKIFANGRDIAPTRVKDCRHPPGRCPRRAACTYYHDPATVAGSTDVKNFMSDAWHFSPTTCGSRARYGIRRVGSVDTLACDLQNISRIESQQLVHQAAHDILCAILSVRAV